MIHSQSRGPLRARGSLYPYLGVLRSPTQTQNEHQRHERNGCVKSLFRPRRLWGDVVKRIYTEKVGISNPPKESGVLPTVDRSLPTVSLVASSGAWSALDCPPLPRKQVPSTMGPPSSWPNLCPALMPHLPSYLLGSRSRQHLELLKNFHMISGTWLNTQWLLDQ